MVAMLAGVLAAAAARAGDPTPCDLDGDGKHDVVAQTADGMVRVQLFDGSGVKQTGYAVQPPLAGCGRFDSTNQRRLVFHAGGTAILIRAMRAPVPLSNADVRTWLDGKGWNFGAIADLDGDGIDDLSMVRFDGAYLRLEALGRASTGTLLELERMYPRVDDGEQLAAVGDLDGDGRGDLVFNGPSGICIRLNEGPTGVDPWPVSFAAPVCRPGAVSLLADLNGDGKQDLVETTAGYTRVTLMDGTTALDGAVLSNGGGTYAVRLAADLNGDGRDDLIGAVDGAPYVRIDLMDGVASIDRAFVGTGDGLYLLRQAADVSGDGRADLLFDGPTVFRVLEMDGVAPIHASWLPNAAGAYDLLDLRSP